MEAKLKAILSDILEVEEDEIHDAFGPVDAPQWDSMNYLRLITAIEEEFNVKLTMEDINSMTDFGRIKAVMGAYLNHPLQ